MQKTKIGIILIVLAALVLISYQNCAEPSYKRSTASNTKTTGGGTEKTCDGLTYFDTESMCLSSTDCGIHNQACTTNNSGCYYCSYNVPPTPTPGGCEAPRYDTIHQCHAGTPCGVPEDEPGTVRCQEVGSCYECVQNQAPQAEVLFSRSGMFFKPNCVAPNYDGDGCVSRFNISKEAGIMYKKITVDLDFKMGNWFPPDTGGMHNLFWLHRASVWRQNVIGYVNVRGSGSSKFKTTHWINVGEDKVSRDANLTPSLLVTGNSYHLYYEVNATTGQIVSRLTRADGTSVVSVSGAYAGGMINTLSPGFFIEFGHKYPGICGAIRCGPEVPSLNFEYSNVTVKGWRQ